MKNCYFDANTLVKYSALPTYREEKGVEIVQRLVNQAEINIFYSSLTLLETWKVLHGELRKGTFGQKRNKAKKNLVNILEQLSTHLSKPPFDILDSQMSEDIMLHAKILIQNYGDYYAVGSMDMIHVALVQNSSIESLVMVSSDKGVKNICDCENIPLFDPEKQE